MYLDIFLRQYLGFSLRLQIPFQVPSLIKQPQEAPPPNGKVLLPIRAFSSFHLHKVNKLFSMQHSIYRSFLLRHKSSFALCSHILKILWYSPEASMDSNVKNLNENQKSQDLPQSLWCIVWGNFFLLPSLEFINFFIFFKGFLNFYLMTIIPVSRRALLVLWIAY